MSAKDKRNARRRELYALNPNKVLAQNRDYQTRNAEQIKRRLRIKKYGTDGMALLAAQDNKCAVCAADLVMRYRNIRSAHLDHDHATGKVRGWPCHKCNLGLGHFEDNPLLLEAAGKYLRG